MRRGKAVIAASRSPGRARRAIQAESGDVERLFFCRSRPLAFLWTAVVTWAVCELHSDVTRHRRRCMLCASEARFPVAATGIPEFQQLGSANGCSGRWDVSTHARNSESRMSLGRITDLV